MPMCYGSIGRDDLGACSCERRQHWVTKFKEALEEIAALRREVFDVKQKYDQLEGWMRSRYGRAPWEPAMEVKLANLRQFEPREPQPPKQTEQAPK